MTRYFYTEPLAAAWMAKHFGMRFADISGVELNWDAEFACFFLPGLSAKEQEWEGNHYVHPDSLPLLGPQPGDLARLRWLDGSVSCREWEAADALPEAALDRDVRIRPTVVQRDGKAFHWPEVDHG